MHKIIGYLRESISGPGLIGWIVELIRPIMAGLGALRDVDLLHNYFGAIGRFLETGWGTLVSVAVGAIIIGSAIHRSAPHGTSEPNPKGRPMSLIIAGVVIIIVGAVIIGIGVTRLQDWTVVASMGVVPDATEIKPSRDGSPV
jgi:hypothetical protein